jgi:hypothetical protein
VAAETPETLVQSLPTERRPAIWPWLVMPLITLLVFYWLYSLDQDNGAASRHASPTEAVQP